MKTKIVNFLKDHWAITLFLIFYFSILAYKLVSNPTPFFDWDESLYLQLGREMVQHVSLIPSWQGMTWLDKPPLIPFFYGIISYIPFVAPEISTRIATLILSTITLVLLYKLYYKVVKETTLTTLIVIGAGLTPIFMQRAQVINIDVFLLLGWLGYIVFYKRLKLSLFFLSLAVFSKSLLGLYPVAIMGIYFVAAFFFKQLDKNDLIARFKTIAVQLGIISIYYIIMFAVYGKAFWIQHIYETHVKRVASSIESHFGHRTFYIDIISEQYLGVPLFRPLDETRYLVDTEVYIFFSLLAINALFVLWQMIKSKKLPLKDLLNGYCLLPWFLFLNITKTKISWYTFPAIPTFSFLLFYPITWFRKYKFLYFGIIAIVAGYVLYNRIIFRNVFDVRYSQPEPHYHLANYAKSQCDNMIAVVEPETRNTFQALEAADLLITTSKWWGSRPSMVYYFGKKIDYLYSTEEFAQKKIDKGSCVVVDIRDKDITNDKGLTILKEFKPWVLLKK